MATSQTVELRVPVNPEMTPAKVNAVIAQFKRLAAQAAGLLAGKSVNIDASKANAQIKALEGEARKATSSLQEIATKGKAAGQQLAEGMSQGSKGAEGMASKLGGLSSLVKGAAFAGLAAGVLSAGKAMVMGNAQIETYQSKFEVLTGSVENATQLMGEIKEFGATTPFEFPELAQASTNLIAFGFGAKEVIPELKKVGDISSAVGAPIGELAELYGKAKVSGTLMAEDINQLVGRGIPVIQEFAKQLGVSEGEVKKLASEGKITFDNLQTAFTDLTAEGGKFSGMMEKQSGTFQGMLSTVQDVFGEVVRTIGGPLFNEAKAALGDLLKVLSGPEVTNAAKQLGEAIGPVVGIIGKTLATLVPVITGLLGPIAGAIQTILGPISQIVDVILGALGGLVTELAGPLTQVLTLVSTVATSLLGPIVQVLGPIFTTLLGVLTPIIDVIGGVAASLTPLAELFGELLGLVLPLVVALNPVVKTMQILGPVLEALAPAVIEIVTVIAQLATSLLGALMPVLNVILPLITSLIGLLVGGAGKALGFIVGLVAELLAGLVSLVAEGLTALIDGIVSAVEWVIKIADEIAQELNPLLKVAQEIWQELAELIEDIWLKVMAEVDKAIASVIGWLNSAVETIEGPVTSAVNTVSNAFDAVADAISSVVTWIADAIAKFLGFKSAADALARGMAFLSGIISTVKGTLTDIGYVIKGAEAGFKVLKQTVSEAWEALTNFQIGKAFEILSAGLIKAKDAAVSYGKETERNERRLADFKKGATGAFAGATAAATEAATITVPTPEPKKTAATKAKETKEKRTAFQLAKEAFELERSNLDTAQQTLETTKKTNAANEGRKLTLSEEVGIEQAKLRSLQAQLKVLQDQLQVTGEGPDAKIGLTLKKGEEDDARRLLNEAVSRVTEATGKVAEMKVKLIPEIDDEEIRKLEFERLKLNVDLGLAPKAELESFLAGDIALLERQLESFTQERLSTITAAREQEQLTEAQFTEAKARIMANGEKEQLAILNEILSKRLDVVNTQYERELAALDIAQAREAEALEMRRANYERVTASIMRASEQLIEFGISDWESENLSDLERQHDAELLSDAEFENKKTLLAQKGAERRAALAAQSRGQELEASRQLALQELAQEQEALTKRLALAKSLGRTDEANEIEAQLAKVQTALETKGDVVLNLSTDLQENLTGVISNLFTGDAEAVKAPFRQAFGILAGALQRLASAKITEVLLGQISGLTGIPGLIASFASKPIIEGIVNSLMGPVFNALLSFPTGGRIDQPTLALVGDASRLGGPNREWIFRDDQLRALLAEAVAVGQEGIISEFRAMRLALEAITGREFILRGDVIAGVVTRATRAYQRRIINPSKG